MKTSGEIRQQSNEREDASIQPPRKQRKPWAIIVTMILAALITVTAGFGFMRLLFSIRTLTDRNVMFQVSGSLTGQLIAITLAAAALFACIKRPAWGRGVSMVFAVAQGIIWAAVLFSPSHDPAFKIAPGAEEAGAYIGRALLGIGVAAYVWSMVFGSKTKAYFAHINRTWPAVRY